MLIYLHLSPAGRSHLAYFATCSMALGLVSSLNSLTAASLLKLSTVNAEGTCRLDEVGWMRFEGLFVNSWPSLVYDQWLIFDGNVLE